MKTLGCANESVICYPDLKPGGGSHDNGNIRSLRQTINQKTLETNMHKTLN